MELDDRYLRELLSRLDGLGAVGIEAVLGCALPMPAEAASAKELLTENTPIAVGRHDTFIPRTPRSFEEAKLSESLVESLVLKQLLHQVTATGRDLAEAVGLPFAIIEKLLSRLKAEQIVVYYGSALLGDYVYQLTTSGSEAALRLVRHASYMGTAPVHLDDYLVSVEAQSVRRHPPSLDDIENAFGCFNLDPLVLNQIGQALRAGKGFFLSGAPGNGKTCIAEHVSEVFGQYIWIPRLLEIDGHMIRLFDPYNHVEASPLNSSQAFDRRWVRIRRPAIIAGGELTMDRLDIVPNHVTGASEAPLQLKSNCGTLVIDDLGRQRLSVSELLNRWIVPLDRNHDFLHLPGGKTVRVPFEQLLIFSTNLEPRDLVDEAFLRRIPYKISLSDPTEEEFTRLIEQYAEKYEVAVCPRAVEHLLERHYRSVGRPFRRCHARDLLAQIRYFCDFNAMPRELTARYFDIAVQNYFTLMALDPPGPRNPTLRMN